jgi:hypothetical protein
VHSDDLDLSVEQHGGVAVATVVGRLGIRTATSLKRQLTKVLLDTGRLIVDVNGLQLRSSAELAVFPTVLSGVGGWPTARMVLCAGGGPVAEGMHTTGRDRDVPVGANLEQASLLLAGRPARVMRWVDLPASLIAPTIARAYAGSAWIDWGIDAAVAERATLVVNELVSNCVLHTTSAGRLTLRHDSDGLWTGVRDESATRPVLPDTPDRHGLRTVAALSTHWGVHSHAVGKTVWALLDTVDGTRPTRGRR